MKNKYMKIQILAIAVLLLGTLTVSGVKETDEVCIKLNFKQGEWDTGTGIGGNDGRWHATGTFVDGGTVHDTYQMDWPSMSSSYEMTGRNGILYIEVELEYAGDLNKWTGKFEGTWTIVGGTDDYADATGGGDATQIIVFGSAMHSAHMVPGTGGPATSNHVVLEGEFYFLPPI